MTGNNSGFTSGITAPEGSQAAFLQGGNTSTISQSVSGFQSPTSYIVKFAAIQRLNCCNAGGQDFQVYLDNNLIGTFHPNTSGYLDYSTATFDTTSGAHVVKFVGLQDGSLDQEQRPGTRGATSERSAFVPAAVPRRP
jgi:hypothetical protein